MLILQKYLLVKARIKFSYLPLNVHNIYQQVELVVVYTYFYTRLLALILALHLTFNEPFSILKRGSN